MTFKETLDKHIKSIENKDIESLIQTMPESGEDTILIMPDGNIDKSRDNFVNGHREWFKSDNWSWKGEVQNIIESNEMAVATLKYTYKQDGDKGSETLLGLVFKKINEKWVLVHDQNTPIK